MSKLSLSVQRLAPERAVSIPDPREASVPQLIAVCDAMTARLRSDPPRDIGEATRLLDRLLAVETYLAKRDAAWAAQTPSRLLEAHIGHLLGEPEVGGRGRKLSSALDSLSPDQRVWFRRMDAYREAWESKLPLSRRAVLRDVELVRRPPADEVLLPSERRYGLIYADPPWSMPSGVADRGLERHYPVMTTEAISAMDVAGITADNAVLFLWAISTHLHDAFHVMDAWGFDYRSSMVWVKDRPGTGWWVRQQHEYLLIGVHGDVSPPAHHLRPVSVIQAPRGQHSAKPVAVAEMLERLWPGVPRIELFSRSPREGWDAVGDEAA